MRRILKSCLSSIRMRKFPIHATGSFWQGGRGHGVPWTAANVKPFTSLVKANTNRFTAFIRHTTCFQEVEHFILLPTFSLFNILPQVDQHQPRCLFGDHPKVPENQAPDLMMRGMLSNTGIRRRVLSLVRLRCTQHPGPRILLLGQRQFLKKWNGQPVVRNLVGPPLPLRLRTRICHFQKNYHNGYNRPP